MSFIIPAIDIKNGLCVRLTQGNPDKQTIYNKNPYKQALIWEREGAKLIHIVDLDGAFQGKPQNLDIIQNITKEINAKIQIGGGIRKLDTIKHYIDIGVEKVIIGSAAYNNKTLLKNAIKLFNGKITVGIDCLNEKVAIHGWKTITNTHINDFIKEITDYGVKEIIITDIKKDGMLSGIDKHFYQKILSITNAYIIASGGISTIKDIEALKSVNNNRLKGVIVGKALYEKAFVLKEAIERIAIT